MVRVLQTQGNHSNAFNGTPSSSTVSTGGAYSRAAEDDTYVGPILSATRNT